MMLDKIAPFLPALRIGLCLALFAAGWTVKGWQVGAQHATELRAEMLGQAQAQKNANAASTLAEKERERSRKIVRDAERKLYHDRESNPDYRCAVPDYGLQLYNQPRFLAGSPGQPDRAVPTP